jgi:hypothetical protein
MPRAENRAESRLLSTSNPLLGGAEAEGFRVGVPAEDPPRRRVSHPSQKDFRAATDSHAKLRQKLQELPRDSIAQSIEEIGFSTAAAVHQAEDTVELLRSPHRAMVLLGEVL